jgi:hypothetical protein
MKHIVFSLIACGLTACTTTGPESTASTPEMDATASLEGSLEVAGLGPVHGPPDALATFRSPFVSVEGRNHTVEACKTAIRREARRFGDVTVEVASRGPHRMNGELIEGTLDVRVIYKRSVGDTVRYLVRASTVQCTMTRKGVVTAVREAG